MRNGYFGLVLAGAAALLSSAAAAEEIEAQEAVCVVKTDRTGGRLGFVVLERDVAAFERAGFQRLACPSNIATQAAALVERCERWESQSATGRRMIEDLYGLSITEMCRATRAWARSLRKGGVP